MKIMITILVIAVVVLTLALFSKKQVSTEIVIDVPTDEVWAVLMDVERYSEWNPVLSPISGQLSHGSTMTYEWRQASGEVMTVQSTVKGFEAQKRLHQQGGIPLVLTFDHQYHLTSEGASTRVVQSELYRGIGVWFWDASAMEPAYQKVNEQLKLRLESE